MKYYTITTGGYILATSKTEAIEILNEIDNAIEAVKVEVEDDIYSSNRTILAVK